MADTGSPEPDLDDAMLLVIDNYDSFTFNLVQYLGELGAKMKVIMNDECSAEEIAHEPGIEKILISPGPGSPKDAGVSCETVRRLAGKIPILGVCLGHQVIGRVFGGRIIRAPKPIHGKPSSVTHDGKGVFAGLEGELEAGRYHSLVVEKRSLPDCLEISAETDDGVIMGLRHTEMRVEGVQFHPESILTPEGKKLLQNFLNF